MRWPSLAYLLLVVVPAVLRAQSPPPRPLCFRGGPADRCERFLITEVGGSLRLTSSRSGPESFVWDVGLMFNHGHPRAYGVSLFMLTDVEDRWLFGVRPRMRVWLTPRWAFDLGPGVLLAGDQAQAFGTVTFPAFSGYAGVSFADWVAVGAQLNVLPSRVLGASSTETSLHVGVRLGSYAGVVVGPAAIAFISWVRTLD